MSEQEYSLVNIIIESILSASSTSANVNDDASVTPPPASSTGKIHRVPQKVKETDYYETTDYVPKVVSIGPYHFRNPKLESAEKMKPYYTMKLLSHKKEILVSLYLKLRDPQMVREIRSFYDEHSTNKFSDEEFTKMMLLDSCFILYYIQNIFRLLRPPLKHLEFKGDEIYYIRRDLFLLENQIPFKVLREVMESVNIPFYTLRRFVYGTIFSSPKPPKFLKWLQSMFWIKYVRERRRSYDAEVPLDHLLHLLHLIVTEKVKAPTFEVWTISELNDGMCNFGPANELVDMEIQFKPSDSTPSACVNFVKGCLELPPITVDDSTKAKWLNLIAFEKVSCSIYNEHWVASYVCFLHSLIEQPEDVKVLRKAWLLGNFTGRDKDVVKLFDGIATGLVPNNYAYLEVKKKIQRHYESWSNTLVSQLKHEYIKSPWSFLALVGALIALFLTAVQTYFTVWSPKSECEDLCKSLKMNHHL